MTMCRYRWLELERLGSEPGLEPCGECTACASEHQLDDPAADAAEQPTDRPATPKPRRPRRGGTPTPR